MRFSQVSCASVRKQRGPAAKKHVYQQLSTMAVAASSDETDLDTAEETWTTSPFHFSSRYNIECDQRRAGSPFFLVFVYNLLFPRKKRPPLQWRRLTLWLRQLCPFRRGIEFRLYKLSLSASQSPSVLYKCTGNPRAHRPKRRFFSLHVLSLSDEHDTSISFNDVLPCTFRSITR